MNFHTDNKDNLPKWYVYELRDPDTLDVFYVGKGSDHRVESHVADPLNRKGLKIAELQRIGKKPLRIIVGRFEDERQAFAVEAVLIKWIYGKGRLTNIVQGHRHKFIRPRDQLDSNEFTSIEGVDIPTKDRTSLMELIEYEKTIQDLQIKRPVLADAIENVTDYMVELVLRMKRDFVLRYRATKTRLSFFIFPADKSFDLAKKAPGEPICRIFFKSAFCTNGTLHISFNRDKDLPFIDELSDFHYTKFGGSDGAVDLGKVDLIVLRPDQWQLSSQRIKALLEGSLQRLGYVEHQEGSPNYRM